jgi:hypothetical protein
MSAESGSLSILPPDGTVLGVESPDQAVGLRKTAKEKSIPMGISPAQTQAPTTQGERNERASKVPIGHNRAHSNVGVEDLQLFGTPSNPKETSNFSREPQLRRNLRKLRQTRNQ